MIRNNDSVFEIYRSNGAYEFAKVLPDYTLGKGSKKFK